MSAVAPNRRRLNPEKRRQMLLEDAVEVFALRGIGRGGHTEIAAMSNVSVATVFNYFKTREALVEAVLEEVERRLLEIANQVYDEHSNPLEAIQAHVTAFLEACERESAYIKVWLEWSASLREETWPSYLEFQNKILDIIAEQVDKGIRQGILEPGLNPKERARWALGNGQMLVSMMFDPNGKPENIAVMIKRGFDHILGVKR